MRVYLVQSVNLKSVAVAVIVHVRVGLH